MGKIIKNIVLLSILAGSFLFTGSQDGRAAGTFSSLAPPLDKLRYQTGQAPLDKLCYQTGQADCPDSSLAPDYSDFSLAPDYSENRKMKEDNQRNQVLINLSLFQDIQRNQVLIDSLFYKRNSGADSFKIGEILSGHSHAWGENVGWVNFRAEGVKLEIGGNILTGWIEIKTLGWVYLGNGKPENGLRYSNSHGRDYGVNNDKEGNLSGYAWSENVGWINFDKVTIYKEGNFFGYAFSKNVGRIKFNSGGSVEYMVKTDPYPWKEIGVREEIKAANGSFPGNESESINICAGSREFTIPPTSISLDLYLDEAGKTIEDEIVLGFETAENKIDLRAAEEVSHARGPPEREQLNIISKQFVVQSFRVADQAVLKGCTAFNLFMDI